MSAHSEMIMRGDDPIDDDLEGDEAPATDFRYALNDAVSVELLRRGPELVVIASSDPKTSETLASMVEGMDWSMLRVSGSRPSDLRSDNVVGFFDAIVDSTVLDQFDQILFVATGEDADAALGFALCAPLSRVLVLGTPQHVTTTGRYPVTPETLSLAESVYMIADRPVDAEVGGALDVPGLCTLAYPQGERMVPTLLRYGVLGDVLAGALDGDLGPVDFARAMRARHADRSYLRTLDGQLFDRPVLRLYVQRYLGHTLGIGRYARSYAELRQSLQDQGVTLPPSHRG